jgi:hypothetical protein
VVQQVNKEWDINKDTMDAYVAKIRKIENKFLGLEIHHVILDNNVRAHVLSKLGSDRANVPPGVFIPELHHPSIKTPDSSTIVQGPKEPDREVLMIEVDWRVIFIDYIQEHKLTPGVDPKSAEATHILWRSKGYVLVMDNLYKCGSASVILMKCVRTEEGREILQEIHEGVYGNYAASRTLVSKAFRSGLPVYTRLPVYKLPVLQQTAPCPGSQPYHYTTFMAVCMMGPVRPGHTGLCTWHTFPRIRDGTWPMLYICCNYL